MTLCKNFFLCLLVALQFMHLLYAQSISTLLSNAFKSLEADSQLKHGIIGFSVVETKTGKPVFERNAQIGLAAASCQKVLTSGAAFELLGREYRYKTELGYSGTIKDSALWGDLYVTGNGDPTLGSWRYASANNAYLLRRWASAIRALGIKKVFGSIRGDDSKFSHQTIPGGWTWDDVGNYYGAGACALNWRENQYDLILKSGKNVGEKVEIVSGLPVQLYNGYLNEIISGEAGSGDQAYIYLPASHNVSLLQGTIPINQNRFSISGAITNPAETIVRDLYFALDSQRIVSFVETDVLNSTLEDLLHKAKASVIFDTYLSPPLDSINYWFLKRSINLYGEALIKTIAYEKTGKGSTQKGVELVKAFWSSQGIDKSAINILDGSGLSPQNRITADALVKAMQYAGSRPWFPSFYDALPEINGLKMKSGSIGGARSFTGYCKSKVGNEYTFAVIVNNYDGSALAMVRKIYALLNVLK